MITQKFAVLVMLSIFAAICALIIAAVVVGHEGLFLLGADSYKYVLGAVVGALATTFARTHEMRPP